MPTDTTHAADGDASERVAIHCDATSYDPASAEPLLFAALRIRGNRILTGRSLILRLDAETARAEAAERLRRALGNRPLIGYFVDFSAVLAERLLGASLPNERIEVSRLYYQRKLRVASKSAVDLRLDRLIQDLDLPVRADDARGKALAAAMAWLRLTQGER